VPQRREQQGRGDDLPPAKNSRAQDRLFCPARSPQSSLRASGAPQHYTQGTVDGESRFSLPRRDSLLSPTLIDWPHARTPPGARASVKDARGSEDPFLWPERGGIARFGTRSQCDSVASSSRTLLWLRERRSLRVLGPHDRHGRYDKSTTSYMQGLGLGRGARCAQRTA
jgi:hypothetical protein